MTAMGLARFLRVEDHTAIDDVVFRANVLEEQVASADAPLMFGAPS